MVFADLRWVSLDGFLGRVPIKDLALEVEEFLSIELHLEALLDGVVMLVDH